MLELAQQATAARMAQRKVMDATPGRPGPLGPYTEDGYLDYTEPSDAWLKENAKLHELMRLESEAWSAWCANKK